MNGGTSAQEGMGRVGRRALLGRGALAGGIALAALAPVDLAAANTPPTTGAALDLKDPAFGAVGDGVADDSAALQKALDRLAANGGGEIALTSGVYRIASPVVENYGGKASSVVIRGLGSATQIFIATGTANKAIVVQNLESLLFEDVTIIGDPSQSVTTDAVVALEFDSCLQVTLRRCDFYGVSSFVANGAVVLANACDLRIEDSAFRGCGARSGLATTVVSSQNWIGLTIIKTDFIDYGYLGGRFISKTPTAAPFAWVGVYNTSASNAPPVQGAILLSNVSMDEGAALGLACLPNTATSGLIESLTITGLRINVAGFGIPNNGVIIQGVEHVLIERSWFGYSPAPPQAQYGPRNAINLRSVNEAVIDSCRCVNGAERILADAATGTLTVRETTYKLLASSAANTQVIQGGLASRVLKADGAIPANGLVMASTANPLRVVVAPAGAQATSILGVALDATANPGDATRVVTVRGSIVQMQSDGGPIAPGDPIGPSSATAGAVATIGSGGLIGRAVQAASGHVLVAVELIDGTLGASTVPLVPPPPTPAALQNGWTNLGGGFGPATFVKTLDNRVELSGVIAGGAVAAGTVLLTLPSGSTPPARLVFPVASGNGYAEIGVNPDGTVTARRGVSANFTSLSGVRFATA